VYDGTTGAVCTDVLKNSHVFPAPPPGLSTLVAVQKLRCDAAGTWSVRHTDHRLLLSVGTTEVTLLSFDRFEQSSKNLNFGDDATVNRAIKPTVTWKFIKFSPFLYRNHRSSWTDRLCYVRLNRRRGLRNIFTSVCEKLLVDLHTCLTWYCIYVFIIICQLIFFTIKLPYVSYKYYFQK